jgi:prevent-host-death family protein
MTIHSPGTDAMAKKRRASEANYTSIDEPTQYSVTEFKARCLELIDRIEHTREELTITRYGKPVAKLVPHEASTGPVFGHLKGTVTILGDIIGPTGEEWEADERNL